MGTSPVSTYVESAVGVQDGGEFFVECGSVCFTVCLPIECLHWVSAQDRRGS